MCSRGACCHEYQGAGARVGRPAAGDEGHNDAGGVLVGLGPGGLADTRSPDGKIHVRAVRGQAG
jgi:hypothetical protein